MYGVLDAVNTVVISIGALPNEGLYDELTKIFGAGENSDASADKGADARVYNIGDSTGIANVKTAVAAGCRLADENG